MAHSWELRRYPLLITPKYLPKLLETLEAAKRRGQKEDKLFKSWISQEILALKVTLPSQHHRDGAGFHQQSHQPKKTPARGC